MKRSDLMPLAQWILQHSARGGVSRRSLPVMLLLGVVACTAPFAQAQDDDEPPLETRVYNVSDLLIRSPNYDFRGTETPQLLLTGSPRSYLGGMSGGTGFGGGGMGGMGGGGMGGGSGTGSGGAGGGFFNVAPEVLAQVSGSAVVPQANELQTMVRKLIDVVYATVDPRSWEEMGGAGTVTTLGATLIVMQTPEVHKKLDELLRALRDAGHTQRSVEIRATWLLLNAQQLAALDAKAGSQASLNRADLAKAAADTKGFVGRIRCFDGQTVHLVAGRARSKIVGAIPVVGSGAAYQPITFAPQAGAVLQVTPVLSADGKTVAIDVRSTVMQADDAGPPAEFLGSAGGEGEDGKATGQVDTLRIDRVNLLVQQFMTTARLPLNQPVLIGGATGQPDPAEDAAASPQLYLFIEAGVHDFGK